MMELVRLTRKPDIMKKSSSKLTEELDTMKMLYSEFIEEITVAIEKARKLKEVLVNKRSYILEYQEDKVPPRLRSPILIRQAAYY